MVIHFTDLENLVEDANWIVEGGDVTSLENWSKEDLIRRVRTLSVENKRLMELQSTYSLALSCVLLEMHESVTGVTVDPGESIEYWTPITTMHRVSEAGLAINTEERELDGNRTPGAHMELVLALSEEIEGNGKKEENPEPA